jgi:hypothetical protein
MRNDEFKKLTESISNIENGVRRFGEGREDGGMGMSDPSDNPDCPYCNDTGMMDDPDAPNTKDTSFSTPCTHCSHGKNTPVREYDESQRLNILDDFLKTFPKAWAKDGASWSDGAVLWSGEGSDVEVVWEGETFELPMFDYWSEDYNETTYIMGVHKEAVAFADKHGCHWEANDPGTYIMYYDGPSN